MRTGLILSGGGARGFAHLGVLQALDELGIEIDAIAGTSAGAIAGAFYLAGHKPIEIKKIITQHKTYEWMRLLWRKPGFLNMEKIGKIFSKYLPDSFEKLNKPLTVCTTDILHCRSVYYSSGPLINAVCASACIPILFEPITFNGSDHADGGILDNFPVEVLRENTKNIIGVHVNAINKSVSKVHFKDVMDRSLHLALSHQVMAKKDDCDVFIEPPDCGRYGILDLHEADKLFDIGYVAAMQVKDHLMNLKSV